MSGGRGYAMGSAKGGVVNAGDRPTRGVAVSGAAA
jgi:hypothetical protein